MRSRRLLAAFIVVLLLVSPFAAGWAWMTAGAKVIELHQVEHAEFRWRPGEPVFLLVLGTDGRPGLSGVRADAIHVIGVNPATQAATILNIPRDSWVDIPGHGYGRVNEAYQYGGAQLQASTVSRMIGGPIHYIAVTDFEGLQRMTDELGGVPVDVPMAMSDAASGAYFPQGRIHMNGGQVLAFSRNRHLPDGDLRRSGHQGQLIINTLMHLRAKGTSATDTLRYLAVLMRHTDAQGLPPLELYRLGRLGLSIDPAKIRNVTLPGRVRMIGARSVVIVPAEQAVPLFADFVDDGVLQAH
ncbi:MAG: LCP family protein [Actinomycetota bacterium]